MDRKGIIGLLICGLLFAAHIYYSTEVNQHKLVEARKAKAEADAKAAAAAPEETPETEPTEGTPSDPLVGDTTTPAAESSVAQGADIPEEEIRLETDKIVFVLTNKGGGVKYAEFKDENAVLLRDAKEKGATAESAGKVRLNRFGKIAVGEMVDGGVDNSLGLTYEIVNQTDSSVLFRATTKSGLVVAKQWSLSNGNREADQYLLDFEVALKNSSPDSSIALNNYGLHAGSAGPLFKGEDSRGTGFFSYDGGLKFKGVTWFGNKGFINKTQRETFEEREDGILYAGVSNQFFATLISKKEPTATTIWAKAPELDLEFTGGGGKKRFVSMAWSLPGASLAPDETRRLKYQVFMGPKDNKVVRQLGEGRGEVMHYGLFSIISRPLNGLLNFYHDNIFSKFADKWAWGFAVVLVTLTIRTLIWPLHNASTKTMKRMSKLQPLMAEIKEKYPDDPQKVQTETMKMYKEYDINPVGGCLPMFAQIPIFFGFYSMLRSAVELRGAEFLWVPDLSLPDTVYEFPFGIPFIGDGNVTPLNLLPLLMVVTMFIQMQLTPKTGDAMQRRIFMLMPFMFFFFCYNFASALALYWTTQNIFSIGQTWWMQRQPEVDLKKRKPGKKSMMQKFAEKAEEAQRLQKQGKKPGSQPAAKPKKPRGPKTGG